MGAALKLAQPFDGRHAERLMRLQLEASARHASTEQSDNAQVAGRSAGDPQQHDGVAQPS